MKEEKTIIIFRENLMQSVIADVTSVGLLLGGFYANSVYIHSRMFSVVVVLLFLLKLVEGKKEEMPTNSYEYLRIGRMVELKNEKCDEISLALKGLDNNK